MNSGSHERATIVHPMTARTLLDEHGHFTSDALVEGPAQLVVALHTWLLESRKRTIGDTGEFGRRAAIRIRLNGKQFAVLNSDTRRDAVREFLDEVSTRGVENCWRVIANRNGVPNKIVFRSDLRPTPGWYCYLKGATAA